jgi:polyisoprenoid-binding protein YceI
MGESAKQVQPSFPRFLGFPFHQWQVASTVLLRLAMAGAFLAAGVAAVLAQGPPPGQGRPPAPPPTAGARLEIMDGSSASYRVQEQLAGVNFPNDAVGATSGVSGTLVIAPDGSVDPSSKLTVDLRTLKSDQDMRDGYLQHRTLETDKYPVAEFVPTKIQGLPVMIPTTGQTGFQLTGNLTIHGTTKEVTFMGIATFGRDSTVAGRAITNFTFATFGITKPSLARVLSVDDKIQLEIVFRFKRS